MFIIIDYNQIIGDSIMVKWMSRVAADKGKSLLPSTIITLAIVAMLIISGPAQAVTVIIAGVKDSYTKGNDINFQVIIELNEQDKFVPITNISLDLTGPVDRTIFFALDGKRISGNCNIEMKPVSIPTANDVGYGYGYDSGYGYKFGYGFGYGYGYGGGGGKISYIYNVTIDTDSKCLPAGDYSVFAALNTGKNVAFQSSTGNFRLLPVAQGQKIMAKVDIKPETINLASKGKFTAFITSDEFDIEEIDGSTVKVTCEGCNSAPAINWNLADNKFIAKFRTQDLQIEHSGKVKFTVTGEANGMKFEGSDNVKVIDNDKDQKDVEECECDDHAKEDDHDDECDDSENDHEGKQINENTPEKYKKEVQKNNNKFGQGKNVIVNNNNININDNSGTININIYNQGSGADINQDGNNNNNANGNKNGNQGNNNKKGNIGKSKK